MTNGHWGQIISELPHHPVLVEAQIGDGDDLEITVGVLLSLGDHSVTLARTWSKRDSYTDIIEIPQEKVKKIRALREIGKIGVRTL